MEVLAREWQIFKSLIKTNGSNLLTKKIFVKVGPVAEGIRYGDVRKKKLNKDIQINKLCHQNVFLKILGLDFGANDN